MSEDSSLEKLGRDLGSGFPEAARDNRRLISVVALIFLLSTATAFVANRVGDNPIDDAIREGTEGTRRALSEGAERSRSAPELVAFFLMNNLVVAVQSIGLGVAFGVSSIFTLIQNGFLIGYVVSESGLSGLQVLSLILPHGVFELTGIVLATSCGVRLGIGSIRSLAERGTGPLREAGESIKGLVLPTVLMIIAAAFVEAALGTFGGPIPGSTILQLGVTGVSLVTFGFILLWMDGRLTGGGWFG